MDTRTEIERLLKQAAAALKTDPRSAVTHLESAYALASGDDAAVVAEELARAWMRRKSPSRSLYYARKATKLSPEQKPVWTTLAKTSELVASRLGDGKQRRAAILYRTAAKSFKKAAALTKDPEDKRWLIELAGDAARQASQ